MRPATQSLLDRLSDGTLSPGSARTVSWHAHREAEAITDRSVIAELASYLPSQPDKAMRAHAYFIIGRVGASLADPTCAATLIAAIPRENDKYTLSVLLRAIAAVPKPPGTNFANVFSLLADSRWLVRLAAIEALDNAAPEDVQPTLIDHLARGIGLRDQIHTIAILHAIGTPSSLPAIAPHLTSRKRDLRLAATLATDAIRGRFPAP